jgi:hypothetical protein
MLKTIVRDSQKLASFPNVSHCLPSDLFTLAVS